MKKLLYLILAMTLMLFASCGKIPDGKAEPSDDPAASEPDSSREESSASEPEPTSELEIYESYGDISGLKDITMSDRYKVSVNGNPIEVLRLDQNISRKNGEKDKLTDVTGASVAMFGFSGMEVTVEVTCSDEITEASVRPLAFGITPEISGKTLTFRISDPKTYISVEINGWTEPLFIFAEEPETDVPNTLSARVLVLEPGEHPKLTESDWNRYDTIYYKAGVHKPEETLDQTSVENHIRVLGSNKSIYLAPGAIVCGAIDVIQGDGCKVYGRGILCGTDWTKKLGSNGNLWALCAVNCTNFTCDGITMLGHTFGSTFLAGTGYEFRKTKIVAFGENSDGINLINDIKVSDVFLFVNDDRLRLQDGINGARVENAVIWSVRNGNTFVDDRGYGIIKDAEYRNIYIFRNELEPYEKMSGNINAKYRESPAVMSNIRFYNVVIEDVIINKYSASIDFDLTNLFDWYRLVPQGEGGNIRDILFSGFTVPAGMKTVFKGADADHTVSGIYLNNYKVGGVVAENTAQAATSVNSYTGDIYFNKGMLALTGPDYDSVVSTGSELTLRAQAYDFTDEITGVDFYIDGEKAGQALYGENSRGENDYSLTCKLTKPGAHTVFAVAHTAGGDSQSSEMTLYAGLNLLENPSFESSDLTMWTLPEQGQTMRRVTWKGVGTTYSPVEPFDGEGYLFVSRPSESYKIISQDVTEALNAVGQGKYILSGALDTCWWTSMSVVLEITDERGVHKYISRGQNLYKNWGFGIDGMIIDVAWSGSLKKAVFYIQSTGEVSAAGDPMPSSKNDTCVDGCKLVFLGETDYTVKQYQSDTGTLPEDFSSSFENGAAGWVWQFPHAAILMNDSCATDGNFSGYVVNENWWNRTGVAGLKLEKGKTYTFSADIKLDGSDEQTIGIYISNDPDGNVYNDNQKVFGSAVFTVGGDGFTHVTVSGTANVNSEKGYIYIRSTQEKFNFYIDNVSFSESGS